MVEVKELAKRAQELSAKDLTDREIADELHLSVDTVQYLVEQGEDGGLPPTDVKIGWRSLGVSGTRISLMSDILADIIIEELDGRKLDAEAVLGIALNGVPFATYLSERLRLDLVGPEGRCRRTTRRSRGSEWW
jgi:orotate phosphoribosyltransferase